ncbi:MAG: hypothetical protein SGPRY_006115, partial [Prymnesium sp.]
MDCGDLTDAARAVRLQLLHSLGWNDVDPETSLFEYGLVSVQASALLDSITQRLRVPLPPDLLITHPTLNELASFVASSLSDNTLAFEQLQQTFGEVPLRGEGSLRGFTIRRAAIEDVQVLTTLDEIAWRPPLQGFTANEIERRVRRFRAGQFVLCDANGMVVGSLYSQRIASVNDLTSVGNFHRAIDLHDDAGPVWQLLSVQIHSSLSSRGLGDLLVNYALTVARASAGVHRVIAVTRCRMWADIRRQTPELSLRDHIDSKADPGIVFHTARGAEVTDFIPGWRPEDVDNDGCGILVEYDLPNFRMMYDNPLPQAKQSQVVAIDGVDNLTSTTKRHTKLDSEQAQRRHLLIKRLGKLVESYVGKEVNVDEPLMEAGLDSYMMQSFVQ